MTNPNPRTMKATQAPAVKPKPDEDALIAGSNGAIGEGPFRLGIEVAASQLRFGLRAPGAEPSYNSDDLFARTGLAAIGRVDRAFTGTPNPETGKYEIDRPAINAISKAVRAFLGKFGLTSKDIARVNVATIASFDRQGLVQVTDTERLRSQLEADFKGKPIGSLNRTSAAVKAEHDYGARADTMLYVTISRNINIDFLVSGATCLSSIAPGGVYARGFRHHEITPEILDDQVKTLLGHSLVTPENAECVDCKKQSCLHSIASGQAIVDLVVAGIRAGQAKSKAAVVKAVTDRADFDPPFLHDKGATARVAGTDGDVIDTAAVFRAARNDDFCKQITLQAGVALGLAIVDHFLKGESGLLPQLIVLGGTPLRGSDRDSSTPATERHTIDGVVRRVLLSKGIDNITVTRSRFSGFTALVGVTMYEG